MKQSTLKQPQSHREVIYSTRTCPECGLDVEWIDDFTWDSLKVVVHKCVGCSHKEVRRYAPECVA